MNEESLKYVAAQLRKPHGDTAQEVGAKMNIGNELINKTTIEALQISPGDHVLEVGMGNGFFAKDILNMANSVHYTGCDYSEPMVVAARELNQSVIKAGQAQFFLAEADNLPFKNKTFDKAFTCNTIYFWGDPGKVISEFHRVLKDSGKLAIALRPKSVMQHYHFVKYDFNLFSKEDVCDLLSSNGFRIDQIVEKEEPDQVVKGEKFRVEALVVCGGKV